MTQRKTAGEMSLIAASDTTKYDPLEVGHALTDDVLKQLGICAQRHNEIFDENEYFIVLIVAGDPLIKGIRRHKYAALLYMPEPRPQQSVYLYNKQKNIMKRLWSLPKAEVMAVVSEMPRVEPQWQSTKRWCDSFFAGTFFQDIRDQYKIKHLSETEYLNANREKLIKSGCKEVDATFSDPFDFSKVTVNKVVNSNAAVLK